MWGKLLWVPSIPWDHIPKTVLFRTLNSESTRVESARVANTLFAGIVEPVWRHFQEA
jgi:hypothetical protein